jgi:hypothetical protein
LPGTCVGYFTLPSTSTTSIIIELVNCLEVPLVTDFDHFLCAAGSANTNSLSASYQVCGAAGTSNNKGKQCTTTTGCPSTSGSFLTCGCQPDASQTQHCPPDFGDSEWSNIMTLVYNCKIRLINSLKLIMQSRRHAMCLEDSFITVIVLICSIRLLAPTIISSTIRSHKGLVHAYGGWQIQNCFQN